MRLVFAIVLFWTLPGLWAQETQTETVAPEVAEQKEDRGPGLLSRGGFSWIRGEAENLTFRPYLGVDMVYGGGLGTTTFNSEGRLVETNSVGAEARYGVAGVKDWKKTEVQLDYRGAFRHYAKDSYYDGLDNSLLLSVSHRPSKRVTVEFGQQAAVYNRSSALPGGLGASYNTLAPALSGNEIFDSPTRMLMSLGRVTFNRSARLSVSAGGAGFLVRRRSAVLMGLNGYMASGDVAYRLSRSSTIGAEYAFTHFGFIHQYGSADMHGVFLNYTSRLDRNWELALRAGGYRTNVWRLGVVSIDPAIAALIGQGQALEIMNNTLYAPAADLRLTRRFRQGTWSAAYSRSVSPGSDIYLTSKNDSVSTSVYYSGSRRVAVNGNLRYNRYSGIAQRIGVFNGYGGGGGVSIRLGRAFSLVGRASAFRREIEGASLTRVITQASVGVLWSPGDYPLAIW